ncbi:DUF4062 domain-containing protein [Janthinobacterium sp. BJB401]|uniref:DUF4062 domain-containing protein n=1 Tax=Janthinobacterium sp. BJB401 TaxID=2745934 RepID=UPI001595B7EF|nr:DUF4062 domain-containing protein [Janthinobacterium sp. BJB401]NVI83602.1 DUF4062 domain-containing protein [Janthinobacterium sp. BJB401]
MATPKVFVSSTCFDLSEIREQLTRFIRSYGFDPILSEHGDVFYKPEFHTHESCIHEVSNCHIFILIIGGRFGGEYISDKTKSITNAEHSAARQSNMPVFTYVKNSVLSNHNVYQKNKKMDFVSNIEYPAIEKQEHAIDIFKFIDEVRKNPTNNAIEGFDNFQGIENHLRKQWAGMFFDLLRSKQISGQMDATNHLISGIKASSQKLEELVKSLYLSSNAEDAKKEIASIEAISEIEKFFEDVLHPYWIKEGTYLLNSSAIDVNNAAKVTPDKKTWDEYLVEIGLFEYTMYPTEPNVDDSDFERGLRCIVTIDENRYFVIGIDEGDSLITSQLFEHAVKKSTQQQRKKH